MRGGRGFEVLSPTGCQVESNRAVALSGIAQGAIYSIAFELA
jgi:hypothetical protein